MLLNELCPDCGRPLANDTMTGAEKDHCFYAIVGDEPTRLDCFEVAVPRLKAELAAVSGARLALAGHALQGILADASAGGIEHASAESRYQVCRAAAQYADALLVALGYPIDGHLPEVSRG